MDNRISASILTVLIILVCFTTISIAQEADSFIAKVEGLKESYLAGNIEKCLSILNELEKLLKEKKSSQIGEYPDLVTLKEVLDSPLDVCSIWSLSVAHQDPEYKLRTSNDVLSKIHSWRNTKNLNQVYDKYKEIKDKLSSMKLTFEYLDELEKVFDRFDLIGNNFAYFLPNDLSRWGVDGIPTIFVNVNGRTGLIITNVTTDTIYNTLQSTSKKRAEKVLVENILPTIHNIYEPFKNTDISYLGISFYYGSKDFSDDSNFGLKPEVVMLVVPMDSCRRFVENEITDQELLDSSDIFLSDRNMINSFKKIKVLIE